MPTHSDPTAALVERLRLHEPALRDIPGVTGCGIGLAADGSRRPVIQVFVGSSAAGRAVADAVAAVLGSRAFDVVVTDVQPPSIGNLAVTPSVITGNNHKIVDVTVSYTSSDNSGNSSTGASGGGV